MACSSATVPRRGGIALGGALSTNGVLRAESSHFTGTIANGGVTFGGAISFNTAQAEPSEVTDGVFIGNHAESDAVASRPHQTTPPRLCIGRSVYVNVMPMVTSPEMEVAGRAPPARSATKHLRTPARCCPIRPTWQNG